MVRIDVLYEGGLRCKLTHEPSQATCSTDAPKDNEGLGLSFSPTDLVASALASCMLTTMGIVARRHQIDMTGAKASVDKHMTLKPVRKIGRLETVIQLPHALSGDQRQLLENAALTCPVHRSLSETVEIPIRFDYIDA